MHISVSGLPLVKCCVTNGHQTYGAAQTESNRLAFREFFYLPTLKLHLRMQTKFLVNVIRRETDKGLQVTSDIVLSDDRMIKFPI